MELLNVYIEGIVWLVRSTEKEIISNLEGYIFGLHNKPEPKYFLKSNDGYCIRVIGMYSIDDVNDKDVKEKKFIYAGDQEFSLISYILQNGWQYHSKTYLSGGSIDHFSVHKHPHEIVFVKDNSK